jgi:hypothetical protein
MIMHSVGLSEDWRQIKEEVELGAMQCWSIGVVDAKLTWSFKLIYSPSPQYPVRPRLTGGASSLLHHSIAPILLLDSSIFAQEGRFEEII